MRDLDKALVGVEAVIDVLNAQAQKAEKAIAFFEGTSTQLLRAEREAGVGHHVALSIVGIDGVPFGYYQGKVRQEEVVAAGQVPWTIQRATQFHEFAGQMLDAFGPAPHRHRAEHGVSADRGLGGRGGTGQARGGRTLRSYAGPGRTRAQAAGADGASHR